MPVVLSLLIKIACPVKVKDVLEEQFGQQLDISDFFIKTSTLKLEVPIYIKERNWDSTNSKYIYTDELDEKHRVYVNLSNEKLVPRDAAGYRDDPVTLDNRPAFTSLDLLKKDANF